ncbi:MAG: family 10 glycosylhydrolase [Lentisphaeria bacterium]|nr:family 10 glycosylhydrolase [Lentisphaeria bacterium]
MSMTRYLVASLVVFSGLLAAIPPVPRKGDVFPELKLADTAAARRLFAPMEGSLPVTLAKGPIDMVRLPVNFVGTDHARASWDIGVRVDLRLARGIQFDFFCADMTPVSYFCVYFRSGDGWYRSTFGTDSRGGWQHVIIDKADTGSEGTPAGWGKIDAIRISMWRGQDLNTECAIANLGAIGSNPTVLIVRADSNSGPGNSESKGYSQFAATVATTLKELGLEYALVADTDVTAEMLAFPKLVFLPYNPHLPETLAPLLRVFVDGGGRLIACYSLPKETGELLGLRKTGWEQGEGGCFAGFERIGTGLEGQPVFAEQRSWVTTVVAPVDAMKADCRVVAVWRDSKNKATEIPAITATATGAFIGHVWMNSGGAAKRSLMLSLLGAILPGVWRDAATAEFANIGAFGTHSDLAQLSRSFPKDASAEAKAELAKAARLRGQAAVATGRKSWRESIAHSQAASEAAMRAWCLLGKPRSNEFRGWWCHSAFGIPGKTWDEAIKELADNGFNAILPNMLWGGLAYYPSETLPVYPEIDAKGDQVDLCLKACKKYGVKCHVWKVNWNMGSRADGAFVKRMVAAKRVQKSFSGEVKERWLCPSHPENRKLEIESMLEVVRKYPVDGVHFDYIRYPDGNFCFCEGCRTRFETGIGHQVENWPGAVREDKKLEQAWLDFRRSNIDAVVKAVSERAHAIRPGVQISAAVFRNWPIDRDGVGQDWKLWCDRKWVDFLCPMDYTPWNETFRSQVVAQVKYAGQVPIYPGIGLSCWSNPSDAVKLVDQIRIAREEGARGFTVFEYNANAESVLPFARLGVTSK